MLYSSVLERRHDTETIKNDHTRLMTYVIVFWFGKLHHKGSAILISMLFYNICERHNEN